MSTNQAEVRRMLHTYGKQLTSAKRLARFRRALLVAGGQDQVDISKQARRRELVQRIAKEIIENLIVNGTQSSVIQNILDHLETFAGARVMLDYPLDGGDVRVLIDTVNGPREATGDEKNRILRQLWEITLAKVDDTML
ncbi:MAG: DVU0524 family FlgM-associated protein [Desulfovibrionaceae bacterium]